MTRRVRLPAPMALLALAGLALLVSHDAIFLVQLGPGEGLARVLRTAGHDFWGAASAGLVGIAAVVAAASLVRLRRLQRRASTLGATWRPAGYARRAARAWGLLFVVVAAGFVVQESVEHFVAHGHAIGLGALLSPEYPLALPVIAVITGAAALVAALVSGTEQALLAGIAAALAQTPRRPHRVQLRAPVTDSHRPSVLSRPGASRAPPSMLAA